MTQKINIHYYCNESECQYSCDIIGLPRSEDGKFHPAPYICPNPINAHINGTALLMEIKEQEA